MTNFRCGDEPFGVQICQKDFPHPQRNKRAMKIEVTNNIVVWKKKIDMRNQCVQTTIQEFHLLAKSSVPRVLLWRRRVTPKPRFASKFAEATLFLCLLPRGAARTNKRLSFQPILLHCPFLAVHFSVFFFFLKVYLYLFEICVRCIAFVESCGMFPVFWLWTVLHFVLNSWFVERDCSKKRKKSESK